MKGAEFSGLVSLILALTYRTSLESTTIKLRKAKGDSQNILGRLNDFLGHVFMIQKDKAHEQKYVENLYLSLLPFAEPYF